MAASRVGLETVKLIPPRQYWIGDEATAHAGPRHLVSFPEPVWIDVRPVSLNDVQKCIINGGLTPKSIQESAKPVHRSVDNLFRIVLDKTVQVFSKRRIAKYPVSSYPACGLLWEEASQICQFFGARLPTEFEWEIGLGWLGESEKLDFRRTTNTSAIISRLGCDCYAGVTEEWTGSEWTSRYWTDLNLNEPKTLTKGTRVSVRGCLATASTASQFARLAIDPDDESTPRIFRRAWDQRPDFDDKQASASPVFT